MQYENIGSNIASLLGGAAIGATVMYLYDPESGSDRREALAESASDAMRSSGKAISSAWEKTREKAGEFGSRSSDIAENIGDSRLMKRMRKQTAKLGRRASKMGATAGSRFSRSASDIGEKVSDIGGNVRDRVRAMWRGRRETAAEKIGLNAGWKQGLAALGLLGLGIGVMYFFDPKRGSHRRRMLRERLFLGAQQSEDRLVFERVRSEIGRCVSKPSLVDASVRHGRVVLSGPILTSEVDGLMKRLWDTPGVSEVINRLEIHGNLETLPGVQTTEEAPLGMPSENMSEANRI